MFKALFASLQVFFGTVLCLSASPIVAQVTSDGTVNTQVNQNGNVSEITGGETRGDNLFHSFQDFSVQTGNEAFFNNADSISNIFSRVTGGNISNIDGLIRANGSASLFLINPAGIVFGQNARLDVGGSFYGSSASSILFENGEFSATDLDNPLLTINAPIGLNLRDAPGDITVRGDGNGARLEDSEVIDTTDALRVDSNATIGFLGGNVSFEDATVKTAGGRIEIGSVAEGTVNLIAVDNGFTFDYSGIETFQDITLSGRSIIDASGLGGGDFQAAGNNISITGVSDFISHTLGSTPGKDINIFAAESLEISGVENELNFVSGIATSTFANSTADAGNINIETGSLTIGDRGLINSSTSGQGNAGNININAIDSITLASQGNTSAIFSRVSAEAVGNSGNVDLVAESIDISNGGAIDLRSFGQGNGGNVTIDATENVSLTNNSSISVVGAPGGSIALNAKNLSITSGSNFFAGINLDIGESEAQSGNITISLTEDLFLDGLNSDDATSISNISFGLGNPGNIEIAARNITFQNGGVIGSISEEQETVRIGSITLNATDDIIFDGIEPTRSGIANDIPENISGSIGDINVTAQNLTVTNGAAILSQVAGTGDSGNINLDVTNSIEVDGFGEGIRSDGSPGILNSQISNTIFPTGNGNAGTIDINTQNLQLSRNGSISAEIGGTGNGGNININAEQITIGEQGNPNASPSSISAQNLAATFGNTEGNGGNITIDTGSLSLVDGGSVDASVSAVGDGGNITINARDTVSVEGTGILLDTSDFSSGISASVFDGDGNAGNIEINTTNLSVADDATISADIVAPNNSGSSVNDGNGGSITINASDSVDISSTARVQVDILDRNATGNGGDLTIETQRLNIEDSAEISAITIGSGNAGSLNLTASESINLSGVTEDNGRSRIFASALEGSGNSGDVNIFTNSLNIEDGAVISVGNFPVSDNSTLSPGTGQPGNLFIQANSMSLSNDARIVGTTQSSVGEGANITLQVAEDISLQDESFISAQAVDRGNGGNLTIDSRFIIAFPSGGSGNDIIASAEQGRGGNISINAEALFGIQERPLSNLTNDINASSQVSGLDGTIDITNPNIDPIQGATELPTNIVVPEETAQQACNSNREAAAGNGLNIVGKGGVPPAPELPLTSLNLANSDTSTSDIPAPIETSKGKIQPARGIKVSETGEISLVAYRTNDAGDRIPEIKPNCDRL